MLNLSNVTSEAIVTFIKENLSKADLKDYFTRSINENNFYDYVELFETLDTREAIGDDDNKTLYNRQMGFYAILKMFLLYRDVLTPDSAKDIKNDVLLSLAFTELELFQNSTIDVFPEKDYVRDYIVRLHYADNRYNGYKDLANIQEEAENIALTGDEMVSALSEYFSENSITSYPSITNSTTVAKNYAWATDSDDNDGGNYLLRYANDSGSEYTVEAVAENVNNLRQASVRLNSNTDHMVYIADNAGTSRSVVMYWSDDEEVAEENLETTPSVTVSALTAAQTNEYYPDYSYSLSTQSTAYQHYNRVIFLALSEKTRAKTIYYNI